MLNLQFAETMELTEAELQDVRGGNITSVCAGENIGCGGSALPARGGFGTPWSITNFWQKYFNDKPDSDYDSRRY
mgnify:FL=1